MARIISARLIPSVIPSKVEESLILAITSSKRCLDCARHDKKPIWATRPLRFEPVASPRKLDTRAGRLAANVKCLKTRPRLLLSLDGFAVSAVGQTRRGEADNSRACAKSEDRPRSLPRGVAASVN